MSTADERREEVLRAAMKVVGTRGLYGTPTMEIANAAGISQAYVFRLFPTKLSLFLAVVDRSFQQIHDSAARPATLAGARVAGHAPDSQPTAYPAVTAVAWMSAASR